MTILESFKPPKTSSKFNTVVGSSLFLNIPIFPPFVHDYHGAERYMLLCLVFKKQKQKELSKQLEQEQILRNGDHMEGYQWGG